jgi:hypothetical protein
MRKNAIIFLIALAVLAPAVLGQAANKPPEPVLSFALEDSITIDPESRFSFLAGDASGENDIASARMSINGKFMALEGLEAEGINSVGMVRVVWDHAKDAGAINIGSLNRIELRLEDLAGRETIAVKYIVIKREAIIRSLVPGFDIVVVREDSASKIFERYSEKYTSEDPDFDLDPRSLVLIPDEAGAASYRIVAENAPLAGVIHNIAIPAAFIEEWEIDPATGIRLIKLGDEGGIEVIKPIEPCVLSGSDYICRFADVGFSLFSVAGQSKPLLCNVCETGDWSECRDGKQTRLGNICGPETGFNCQPTVESRDCGPQPPTTGEVRPQPRPISAFDLIVVPVLGLLLVTAILFRRRKSGPTAIR